MASEETLRLLLQNKFDRIENLVQMNHAATLAVPSILAAIWGVEGGLNNFQNAWILSLISIGLLLLWRYFAHYLDDDIVTTYTHIVKIENGLHVPVKMSLFNNLIESIQEICSEKDPELFQFIKNLSPEKKIRFFECLREEKKMGSRGHQDWDKLATLLSVIFFVVTILSFGFLPLFGGVILFFSYVFVVNLKEYQTDPTNGDLKLSLIKIECPFIETK